MNDYSVVIPAYNAAKSISDTLQTVLSQTIAAKEIIVVDDGSTDDTVILARQVSGPVRILQQENTGPGGATTAGIKAVKSQFVATLDSDDLWSPGKVERQLAILQKASDKTAVFCKIVSFADPAFADQLDGHPEIGQVKDGWIRSTMCMPTDIALGNGPLLDAALKFGDMVDWLARLKEGGTNLTMMPDILAHRRVHPSSLSFHRDVSRDRGYLEAARQAILRKRALLKAQGEQGSGMGPGNK
ncbi:glycosyltransferase family A protein [Cohaesibacter celericrescens]|uniref:Glycosyltransferase family 2 protein n=1 Tax=Cohaesibacter celericrescens TaxID=2067669 RepID=A0A2N5XQD2_9HYPH|nr:glycosyltransferase family A protein [Cohaesibacter celericrescens]PLW76638.1 glycosyltransferase family 2 protein [Cohaesibacter celericrescens]